MAIMSKFRLSLVPAGVIGGVIISAVSLIIAFISLILCFQWAGIDAHEVGVMTEKPYFFGSGGIRNDTLSTGRHFVWTSTRIDRVSMAPMKIDETFEHLTTGTTTQVDFHTYLQIKVTDPVALVKLGIDDNAWYVNNIKEKYRQLVRDESRKYSFTELLAGQTTLSTMENHIRDEMNVIIKANNIPVVVMAVNLGKATPNKQVQESLDETSVAQQKQKTMREMTIAEQERKKAEEARADADNAYRNKMNLSPDQFVQLQSVQRYSEACKNGGCYIFTGPTGSIVAPSYQHK